MSAFGSWLGALLGRDAVSENTAERSLPAEDSQLPQSLQNMPPSLSEIVLGNRYRLELFIGRGSSAVVYRAKDEVLDQTVAIKLLLRDGILASEQAERIAASLRDETRAAMKLSHPHILRVYNFERTGDWEYVVMEFVTGETLSQLVQRRTLAQLSLRELVRYGRDVLTALHYAHGEGVIHNDIKPGNIMLCRPGGIKLCDFGLARTTGQAWKETIAGTPAYMSPERIMGKAGDARSDLYSLAATLYCLGNGQPPFGRAPERAVRGHLTMPVPETSALHPAVHAVLVKALAKEPDDRYPDAAAFSEALTAAGDEALGEGSATRRGRVSQPPGKDAAALARDAAPDALAPEAVVDGASTGEDEPTDPALSAEVVQPAIEAAPVETASPPPTPPAPVARRAAAPMLGSDLPSIGSSPSTEREAPRWEQKAPVERAPAPRPDRFVSTPSLADATPTSRRGLQAQDRFVSLPSIAPAPRTAPADGIQASHRAAPTPAAPPSADLSRRFTSLPSTAPAAPADPAAAAAPAPVPAPRTPTAPALPFAPSDLAAVEAATLASAHERVPVEIGRFFLEIHPVTNARYARFVSETGELPPMSWKGTTPPAGLEDHPVTGVSLEQARRFARWAGRRLPTQLEWELAARGADGRRFPWGDQPEPERCHAPPRGGSGTAPVGSHPKGATTAGIHDLLGNVWEWTEPDPSATAPERGYAWVYGGSYRHAAVKDGHVARTSVSASNAYAYLGFRCAVDGSTYR